MERLVKTAAAAVFMMVVLAGFSAHAATYPGTIDVDEIKPGMKGYGLSVFSGEKPERFEVEVVGIMPNALTRQDLIMVMCSGQGLEKSKIVAGMSGSPIYLDGRLAGALAYGWGFSQDPLAGVTPIKYMIKAANTKTTDLAASMPGPAEAAAMPGIFSAVTGSAGEPGQETSVAFAQARMTPISTPILASGWSAAGLQALARELEPFHMIPVAGGGMGSLELDRAVMDNMVPGSAIGAALVSGDLSLTAIGTLTWREGDKVAAFGHPFLEAGPVSMPLVSAKILTVVSSQAVSFKLGFPEVGIGALTMDGQAAIVGRLGRRAEVVPMNVHITREATDLKEDYHLVLAKNPVLTPVFIKIALAEVIKAAAPSIEPATVQARSRLRLSNYGEVEYDDVYAVVRNNFSMGYMDPVIFFMRNPFEQIQIEGVDIDLEITDQLKAASILSVATDTDEVAPGDTVELVVVLKPYNEDQVEYRFEVPVPDDEKIKQLAFNISGGNRAMPDEAFPRDVPSMIKFMNAVYSADTLVVSCLTPGQGVDVNGARLRGLPPSISSVLQPGNDSNNNAAPELMTFVKKTPYVIMGGERYVIKIDSQIKRKRR